MTAAALPAASPCIGICQLHELARVCIGCGRTGDEIASWHGAADGERHDIVAALPDRLSALDALPLADVTGAAPVQAVLRETIKRRDSAVVVGCHGAVAEFMAAPGERPAVVVNDGELRATVTGGALRLSLTDDLAIFATQPNGSAKAQPRLLAAPAIRLARPAASGLARLGADKAAIDPAGVPHGHGARNDRAAPADSTTEPVLYDLGLGHDAMRFMVRTVHPALIARLDALSGAPLAKVLAEAGAMLIEASPDRVVETTLCRVEVTTPIPPPGGRSPRAPHTHLLPGALALGRLLPPGIGTPPGHTPVALLYGGEAAP